MEYHKRLLKSLSNINLKISEAFFGFYSKIKGAHRSKHLLFATVFTSVALFLLTPQPAEAAFFIPALLVTGLLATLFGGDLLGEVALGIMSFLAAFLFPLITGIVSAITTLLSNLLVAFTYVAKVFMEYAMNFTLATRYSYEGAEAAGVINAAWPIFRDLANMGIILVLVAIGIGTILNLKSANKNYLAWLLLIALLINFTPIIAGMVIDLGNISMRLFFDAAQNTSDAFLANNPFAGLMEQIRQAASVLGALSTGQTGEGLPDAGTLELIWVVVTALAIIGFQVVLMFSYLLFAALFLMRTLVLQMLVILAPIAFLAFILPSSRKTFEKWWKNLLCWSFIGLPLMISLWLAGVFLNQTHSLVCNSIQTDEGGIVTNINNEDYEALVEVQNNNLGEYEYDINDDGSEFLRQQEGSPGLVGPDFGAVIYDIANAQMMCGVSAALFAFGTLFMGVMFSVKTCAPGANWIIGKAKQLKSSATKKIRQETREYGRAGKEKVKEAGREVGAGATARLGQEMQRGVKSNIPGFRSTGLKLQKPAQKWADQYKQYSKEFDNLSFDQMKGTLHDRGDRGSAAWKYAAQNHAEDLQKYVESSKPARKDFAHMFLKSQVRGDDSMKEAEKLFPEQVAIFKAKRKLEGGQMKEVAERSGGELYTKLEDIPEKEVQKEAQKELDKMFGKMDTKELSGLSAQTFESPEVIESIKRSGKENTGLLREIAKDMDKMRSYTQGSQKAMQKGLMRDMSKIRQTDPKLYGEMQKLERYIGEGEAAAGRGKHEAVEDVEKYQAQLYSLLNSWQKENEPASQVDVNIKSDPMFGAMLKSAGMGRKDVIDLLSKELRSSQQTQGEQGNKPEQPKEENK